MRTLRAAASAVLVMAALAVIGSSAALAADPDGGSLDPNATSIRWTGATFEQVETPRGTCDPTGQACDVFTLTVEADPAYWETHDGSVTVAIEWGLPEDDLDLYAVAGDGTLVGSSAATSGTREQVTFEEPSGVYEIRVAAVSVVYDGYIGSASLESHEVALGTGSETGPTGASGPGGATGDTGATGSIGTGGAGGGGSDEGSADGDPQDEPDGAGHGSASGEPRDQVATAARARSLPAFGFAQAPFDARTFDSRPSSTVGQAAGAEVEGDVTPVAQREEAVVSTAPTPMLIETRSSSVGRFPESGWIVLALGMLGLSLTALAVEERDAREPGRGSRIRRWLRRPAHPATAGSAAGTSRVRLRIAFPRRR